LNVWFKHTGFRAVMVVLSGLAPGSNDYDHLFSAHFAGILSRSIEVDCVPMVCSLGIPELGDQDIPTLV
jgi:hypothetical protein